MGWELPGSYNFRVKNAKCSKIAVDDDTIGILHKVHNALFINSTFKIKI